MSTTIWVNYLDDGKVSRDVSDQSTLYQYASRLDEMCARLDVRKLSDFHDLTDASCNLTGKRLPGGVETTCQLMALHGKWFRPESGIETIGGLLDHLRRHPVRFGLVADRYSRVITDLEECLESIRRAHEKGAKFHLSVVL